MPNFNWFYGNVKCEQSRRFFVAGGSRRCCRGIRWIIAMRETFNATHSSMWCELRTRTCVSFSMYRAAPPFRRFANLMYAAYWRHIFYIHDVQKKHLSAEKKTKCSPNGSHCDKLRTLFFFTFFNIPKKFTGNAWIITELLQCHSFHVLTSYSIDVWFIH